MKKKFGDIYLKIKQVFKNIFNFVDKKNRFNYMETVALMLITAMFGMLIGGILMYKKGSLNTGIKKELNEFVNTYTEILNEYYEEIPENELLEAGIKGMISYLGDPYSVYMDEETAVAFNEKVNGEYVGIGTEIVQYSDGKIEFINVYETGPAYKAGIRKNDILIKVADQSVLEMEITEVSNLVKGENGTKVKITVLRGEEELSFDVKRENIDITSVSSKLIEVDNKKLGYIQIDIFAANTKEQFEKELEKLEDKKIDSLIIDVRNNSGGYLTVVSDILSMFLEKGELVYQLKTKEEIEKIYDKSEEKREYQIVVLVNGSSASASELLASALKESYKADIVGTLTYGKSKVQKTQELNNGGTIKFTFQEWLTPKGESVDGKGLEPDHIVSYVPSEEKNGYDSQLQKAINLLIGKDDENEKIN